MKYFQRDKVSLLDRVDSSLPKGRKIFRLCRTPIFLYNDNAQRKGTHGNASGHPSPVADPRKDGANIKEQGGYFKMKRNGDFLRTFFHAALVSYFHADMTVMATELYYSIDALKQAMESQDDEIASTLFEHLTQYCLRKDLSMDALLYAAASND